MVDREKFSERFKKLKVERNMTSTGIAKELGITKQSVHTWENMKTVPSADKLVELSNMFDCSVDYLVGRSDNPERC